MAQKPFVQPQDQPAGVAEKWGGGGGGLNSRNTEKHKGNVLRRKKLDLPSLEPVFMAQEFSTLQATGHFRKPIILGLECRIFVDFC